MFKIDGIILFATVGALHAIFFALVLWMRKKNGVANKILAFCLIVTSIRIAKNIVVHIRLLDPEFPMPYELWRTLVNFGITHQFAIGPLFLLYFKASLNRSFYLHKRQLLHFLPYFVLVPLSYYLTWPFWRDGGLWLSYLHILIYYLWAFKIFHLTKSSENLEVEQSQLQWLRNLLILAGLLMLAYSPALFKYVGYIGGAVFYAAGIYFISITILRGERYQKNNKKYQTSALSDKHANAIKIQLEKLMETQKPYLDTELSLTKLSNLLNVSPNYLSQVINTQYQQSYAEYISQYRIEAFKNKVLDPQFQNLKIASLAYDCGFKAISTFNTLFKKHTGLTPSEFKKRKEET